MCRSIWSTKLATHSPTSTFVPSTSPWPRNHSRFCFLQMRGSGQTYQKEQWRANNQRIHTENSNQVGSWGQGEWQSRLVYFPSTKVARVVFSLKRHIQVFLLKPSSKWFQMLNVNSAGILNVHIRAIPLWIKDETTVHDIVCVPSHNMHKLSTKEQSIFLDSDTQTWTHPLSWIRRTSGTSSSSHFRSSNCIFQYSLQRYSSKDKELQR